MQKAVPRWAEFLFGALFRFVMGGFGVSLPHPYRTSFCVPFWTSLFGCTVGLPFVLFGWVVRLIFGKGRAQKMWDVVAEFAGSPFAKVFAVAVAVACIAGLAVLLILSGKWLDFLMVVGGNAALLVAVLGLLWLVSKADEWGHERNAHRPRKPVAAKAKRAPHPFFVFAGKFFGLVGTALVLVLGGIWNVFAFFGLMFATVYKKFCPLAEFP